MLPHAYENIIKNGNTTLIASQVIKAILFIPTVILICQARNILLQFLRNDKITISKFEVRMLEGSLGWVLFMNGYRVIVQLYKMWLVMFAFFANLKYQHEFGTKFEVIIVMLGCFIGVMIRLPYVLLLLNQFNEKGTMRRALGDIKQFQYGSEADVSIENESLNETED